MGNDAVEYAETVETIRSINAQMIECEERLNRRMKEIEEKLWLLNHVILTETTGQQDYTYMDGSPR